MTLSRSQFNTAATRVVVRLRYTLQGVEFFVLKWFQHAKHEIVNNEGDT